MLLPTKTKQAPFSPEQPLKAACVAYLKRRTQYLKPRTVVPSDSGIETLARSVLSLIKAIARVHHWPEQIINGKFKGRHSISQVTGIEERYAGRILNCAFLAPDIVEAILEGRQPVDLGIRNC
jgi:hypothetical protein